jgi:hypothetical protein
MLKKAGAKKAYAFQEKRLLATNRLLRQYLINQNKTKLSKVSIPALVYWSDRYMAAPYVPRKGGFVRYQTGSPVSKSNILKNILLAKVYGYF